MLLSALSPRKRRSLKDLPQCCQNRENITIIWERYDLRRITCQECGHVYRRFYAEPGKLGVIRGGK